MALIQDNKMLTTEAKKTAESIRFAFLGTMFPRVEEKYGIKYICFSDGKNNVFVSTKALNQLQYVSNLNNACRAAGVKVDLSAYARNIMNDAEVSRAVYGAMNNKYIGEEVEVLDNARDMFFSEQEEKEHASHVSGSGEVGKTASAKLAYIKSMISKFPQMARDAGLDITMTNAAMDALRQDVKHIEAYRERSALKSFEVPEKE